MKLKGRKFYNVDMIQAESKATLRNLSETDFITCFDNWKKKKKMEQTWCWLISDWLIELERSGNIYSGIYRKAELVPKRKNEAMCCAPSNHEFSFKEVRLLLTAEAGELRGRFLEVLPTSVSFSVPVFFSALQLARQCNSVGGKAPGEEIEGEETTGIYRPSKGINWTTHL
ncbi:hypothetical protein LAZ67_17002443 [Cordylochernes scorpioides]|uniref:Uncharacterized protein n=1 Tax=Cordylochernes scorpioides TaxID=51811 RepID=A0ABY6LEW3_9ARAC|nr:hypothetical protein LAZ67_17002443 [Cordylochernes scorpioides]